MSETISKERRSEFLADYRELVKRHNINISTCGCCGLWLSSAAGIWDHTHHEDGSVTSTFTEDRVTDSNLDVIINELE